MSTKTTFKRISLVAVDALASDMVAAVPSFAGAVDAAPTISISTPATASSGGTSVPKL